MDGRGFMPSEEVVAGIRADVARYEEERVKAHNAVRWRVPVFLGVTLVLVAGLAAAFNVVADPREQWSSAPHIFLYVIAFIGAFFIYAWAMNPATKLQQSFREKLLPVVFGFIEGVSYQRNKTPHSFARLPAETVGTFNRQSFDDVIAGRYEGFPFELYEATLSQKVGKSTSTIFRGVIVSFETTVAFPGLLVAAQRSNTVTKFFRGIFKSKLEELQCGVPALDEAYDFRTDNAEAARPLVTGRLPKALQWLREAWPEQPARLALKGADGFLLIPVAKNFFELPGISAPLDYARHVEPMVADMAALLATAALVRQVGEADEAAAAAG